MVSAVGHRRDGASELKWAEACGRVDIDWCVMHAIVVMWREWREERGDVELRIVLD